MSAQPDPTTAPPVGTLLVIDVDSDRAQRLARQLAVDGWPAEPARSSDQARLLSARNAPSLIILGELDPPRAALDLLEEIRRPADAGPWDPDVPVLMLGCGADELDLLRAFDGGADDFLADADRRYLELRARLRALLRRSAARTPARRRLRVGALAIDTVSRTASVDGRAVALSRLEFDLLAYLAGEPERVFTKEELLRQVWGFRALGATRTLDSHASRLRRKLGSPDGRWIVNVWGVGYRLIA